MSDLITLPITNPVTQFLLILIIILFVPLLFNKIKMPSLLGLIIAGMAIGPLGLNIIDRDASFNLFGTAGLLFIMFLAGLDTDVSEFKRNSSKSALFGLLTFVFPFAFSFLIAYFVLGLGVMPSILIGAMIAPHTPITYPIVTKYDAHKNIAVGITLGGTLITNIISFLIIIVVVGMSTGDVTQTFWVRLSISIVIFAAIMAFVYPVVTRWFFKSFQDNVLQFIFVLVMLFMGAFIAELAGIERIIGALFAGMSLNRLIPRTSPLMNRISFVSNSIFIPFFLIGVGMLVSVTAFISDLQTIVVGVALTAAALTSKYLAAFVTQKLLGYSVGQLQVINGLSSAQSASTLAVVIVGYNLGLFNDALLNGSLIMILVTCTTSAIHTELGSQKIALATAGDDVAATDEDDDQGRILISISSPETVDELVNLSTMIKKPQSKTGLYALNIITSHDYTETDDQNAVKVLESAQNIAAATDNKLTVLLRHDVNIVNGITNVIKENKITALVLGISHEKGMSDAFIGRLNKGILAKSNVTTLIYKTAQPIATVKRHMIIVPKGAEAEVGFAFWLVKVWNIAVNSGTTLVFFGSKETLDIIREVHSKYTVPCDFVEFNEWDDFLILSREFAKDDDLVFVLSRRGWGSYHEYMDKLPYYLNKYFQGYNYILIFPRQAGANESDGPVNSIEELSNTLTSLFHKRLG